MGDIRDEVEPSHAHYLQLTPLVEWLELASRFLSHIEGLPWRMPGRSSPSWLCLSYGWSRYYLSSACIQPPDPPVAQHQQSIPRSPTGDCQGTGIDPRSSRQYLPQRLVDSVDPHQCFGSSFWTRISVSQRFLLAPRTSRTGMVRSSLSIMSRASFVYIVKVIETVPTDSYSQLRRHVVHYPVEDGAEQCRS